MTHKKGNLVKFFQARAQREKYNATVSILISPLTQNPYRQVQLVCQSSIAYIKDDNRLQQVKAFQFITYNLRNKMRLNLRIL